MDQNDQEEGGLQEVTQAEAQEATHLKTMMETMKMTMRTVGAIPLLTGGTDPHQTTFPRATLAQSPMTV